MFILTAIIVGVIVGIAVGLLFYEGIDSLIMNIVLGTAGSMSGLAIYFLATGLDSDSLFDVKQIALSVIFALIFVFVYNLIQRIVGKRVSKQNIPGDED